MSDQNEIRSEGHTASPVFRTADKGERKAMLSIVLCQGGWDSYVIRLSPEFRTAKEIHVILQSMGANDLRVGFGMYKTEPSVGWDWETPNPSWHHIIGGNAEDKVAKRPVPAIDDYQFLKVATDRALGNNSACVTVLALA